MGTAVTMRDGRTGVAAVVVCSLLSAMTWANATVSQADRTLVAEPPKQLQEFELTDQEGRKLRLSALRGRPILVFFGFTRCPDVCPVALHKLKLLTQSHGRELKHPRVVMISVDAAHDSPAAMKRYLAAYSDKFIGLTGEPERVRNVAAQFSTAFFPSFKKDAAGQPLVEHSSQVYLVDGAGQLRATFFDASIETMARVTAEILFSG